jgi:hypothetical protein
LTSSLASAQTPARTCSCRKSSMSLAKAIVMATLCGVGKIASNLRLWSGRSRSSALMGAGNRGSLWA